MWPPPSSSLQNTLNPLMLWTSLTFSSISQKKTLTLKKLTWLSQTYLDNLCILWSIDLGLKLYLQPSFTVVLKLMLDWITRRQESWSHVQNSACHTNPWWSLKTSITFYHSPAFKAWDFKYFFLLKNHTNWVSIIISCHCVLCIYKTPYVWKRPSASPTLSLTAPPHVAKLTS